MRRMGVHLLFAATFVLLLGQSYGRAYSIQSLEGTWVARETKNGNEFPATVPGGIYSDLMNANLIDDIFYGYNDNNTRWVGRTNWTYALNFTVEEGLLEHDQVNLVFEGVDTIATIEVNDVRIGQTENMFVRYVFDVTEVLKAEGNNTLRVSFFNPVERSLQLNNEQLKLYRVPWECPPEVYHGECHINMIRKMQASFGWDWGPSFASMGLWKPVYLEAYDETAIQYVVSRVEESEGGGYWTVFLDTYFAGNRRGSVTGSLTVIISVDNNQQVAQTVDVNETHNDHGEIVSSMSLTIEKSRVQLWWPNGYGGNSNPLTTLQPLYNVNVTFTSSQSDDDVSNRSFNIGFRTVVLVQEPLTSGSSYYYKINGQPIYFKGTNLIPINILPERGQDHEQIRFILQMVKEANMNVLRVWGGGVYESDYLYTVADEMGIMIWQDFMFACSLYPVNDDFLSNARAEIDHNIKRIFYHPSIIIYSGNNENEGVLADNWYNTADNFDQLKKDYVKLYIDTVRTEFQRLVGGKGLFITSSPTNGPLSESEGWVGTTVSNQFYGDVHFYDYDLDPWDSTNFPIPRFISEYGYMSEPSLATWMTSTNNTGDLVITSDFMNWRQHNTAGNGALMRLMEANLRLPSKESENFVPAFIYLSQVYSAQGVRVASEHYRRYRSYLTEDGRGYTMGALYWQLNDVWPGPSWAGIDSEMRLKMLHYFAKYFFDNIIVTGHMNNAGELQLYTVNDLPTPVHDASVLLRVYRYNSPDFSPVYENRMSVTLNASASQLIQTIQPAEFLAQQNCEASSCFFYFQIYSNDSSNSVSISPENYVFPEKLKNSNLASSNLSISSVVETSDQQVFEVFVSSDNIALFVWLESTLEGRFSENGFIQVQNSRKVFFISDEVITKEALQSSLTVTHLMDSRWS